MRGLFVLLLLGLAVGVWAQDASKSDKSSANSPKQSASSPAKPAPSGTVNEVPPQSDQVNVNDLGDAPGESSSKDTQIDISPPADDARLHPQSAEAVASEEASGDSGEVSEFHPWDPHKAAKDVEVGDFYFKRKNYIAAESRYREALRYKDNDAIAIFRLAVCLEKMGRPDEALEEYESYLKILPHGPEAEEAKKAIDRLNSPAANPKPAK